MTRFAVQSNAQSENGLAQPMKGHMENTTPTAKKPTIPNDTEKPELIFGEHPNPKKYFTEGPLIPLSYYNDPESGEMVERSPEVMKVIWDCYRAVHGKNK